MLLASLAKECGATLVEVTGLGRCAWSRWYGAWSRIHQNEVMVSAKKISSDLCRSAAPGKISTNLKYYFLIFSPLDPP
jgi:hypothetical protein